MASYWLGSGSERYVLYYSQEFKKAGAWDEVGYGLIFRHPGISSMSETKRNGVGRKTYLLSHRN